MDLFQFGTSCLSGITWMSTEFDRTFLWKYGSSPDRMLVHFKRMCAFKLNKVWSGFCVPTDWMSSNRCVSAELTSLCVFWEGQKRLKKISISRKNMDDDLKGTILRARLWMSKQQSHKRARARPNENRKLWTRRIDLNERNSKNFLAAIPGKWILILSRRYRGLMVAEPLQFDKDLPEIANQIVYPSGYDHYPSASSSCLGTCKLKESSWKNQHARILNDNRNHQLSLALCGKLFSAKTRRVCPKLWSFDSRPNAECRRLHSMDKKLWSNF